MSNSNGFLKIIRLCNGFMNSKNRDLCRPFIVDEKHVGLIPPYVFKYLHEFPSVLQIEPPKDDSSVETVVLDPKLTTFEERSEKLAIVLEELRKKDVFFTLKGWRDETHDVWHKHSEPPLLKMERTATCLFGTVQYGVHINGYFNHPQKGMFVWVAKRSPLKPTWPGKLDQMVAGGLKSGESVLECAKRECQEEASIPDDILENIKPVGCVSYFYEDRRGLLPEVQFIFDLEVPKDFVPENADGEVQCFQLYPIDELKELITKDEFKFTCAIVVLDFLMRHGEITPDNEPNYTTLVEGMHTKLDYGT